MVLKEIGELFDSFVRIIWEIIKVIGVMIFFVFILIGKAIKAFFYLLYLIFIFPILWILRKIYWGLKDWWYGRSRRKRRREIEIYGEE